jgi:hypothetical protein
MFCLNIKGDFHGEIDSSEMRRDWEEVRALAAKLGSAKWEYRAQAELGFADFYDGDVSASQRNVAAALGRGSESGHTGITVWPDGCVPLRPWKSVPAVCPRHTNLCTRTFSSGRCGNPVGGLVLHSGVPSTLQSCVSSPAVCQAATPVPFEGTTHYSFTGGPGGPTVGLGVEHKYGRVKFAPEVRYTHLSNPTANVLTVMVGVTF